jgi:hypothetical protein
MLREHRLPIAAAHDQMATLARLECAILLGEIAAKLAAIHAEL